LFFHDRRIAFPAPDRRNSENIVPIQDLKQDFHFQDYARNAASGKKLSGAGPGIDRRGRSERFFEEHPKDEYTVRVRIPRTDTR